MTPAELKRQYQAAHPEGHYFDRGSMRHAGDTMANYGVRDAGDYFELYRKRPVRDGATASHYFRKCTYWTTHDPVGSPSPEKIPEALDTSAVARLHTFCGKVAISLTGSELVYVTPCEAVRLAQALQAIAKELRGGPDVGALRVARET